MYVIFILERPRVVVFCTDLQDVCQTCMYVGTYMHHTYTKEQSSLYFPLFLASLFKGCFHVVTRDAPVSTSQQLSTLTRGKYSELPIKGQFRHQV